MVLDGTHHTSHSLLTRLHAFLCQLHSHSDQQKIMLCSSTQLPIFKHSCQPVRLREDLESPQSLSYNQHSASINQPTAESIKPETSLNNKHCPAYPSATTDVRSLLSCSCYQATKLAVSHLVRSQSWLCLLLLLSLAGGSWAQGSGSCPVSIEYAASLGQGGANADVPVFVGSLGITNNANVRPLHHRQAWATLRSHLYMC